MNRIANSIANRLSLREPQKASLELLAEIDTLVDPHKDQEATEVLAAIQARYPKVEDFERDFPSLCFALATGVGKTRLMGASPRIKRLAEYIGQSYFDYLAELPDLVLIMDEAHRYRAAAGMRAVNELKPILGLELTATPFVESTGNNRTAFRNVIYDYPLSNAMRDGFVKEPAVATRENFNASDYSDAQLETLKLQDGVRVHENTKVVATYGR